MIGKKKAGREGAALMIPEKREISVADLKASCLELLDEVERLGIEVTVTKRRRPVARIVPIRRGKMCGALAGAVAEMHDLISPIDATA